jgi:ribosomal protein L7Ae-like RNA K-turn-binding protein
MKPNLLSTLGLARRGGMLAVGEEPVEAAARAKDARLILLAADAAENTVRRARHFSEAGACLWLRVPFRKDELGSAVGRMSCAILALTDVGFAAAVARCLADGNPAQYGESAEKLTVKAKRAAERRAEQRAHEKNLRRVKTQHPAPPLRKEPEKEPVKAPEREAHPAAKRRPFRSERRRARPASAYARSLPVKKGRGSFRKKDGSP